MEPENSPPDEARSYSIALRVRRITQEYAFLRVPVTAEIIDEQPDGRGRINVEKMTRVALEMGNRSGVRWYAERSEIDVHPIQKPLDAGEEYSNEPFRPPDEPAL